MSAVRWCECNRNLCVVCGLLPAFWSKLELIRHAAELRKRAGLHLSHQTATMYLHRPFRETDIGGDLLAKAALRDMNHDLPLARAQGFKAFPESSQILFTCPPGAIASEAGLDRIKQV